MDIFDIIQRSEFENTPFVKEIHYKTVRKRFTDIFGKLCCGVTNEVTKAFIGNYVDFNNCNHPVNPTFDDKDFEMLIYVKNILLWLDSKNIDARTDIKTIVKTNDIDVGEEISEINLYSPLTNLNTDSLEQGCITPVANAVSSEHKDSLKNHDLTFKNTYELENCSNNKSHNPCIQTTFYSNINHEKEHLRYIDINSNKGDNITETFNEFVEKDDVVEENNVVCLPNSKNKILQKFKVDSIQKKNNIADEENSLLERSFNSDMNSVDDGYIGDLKKVSSNKYFTSKNKFTGKRRSESDSRQNKKTKKRESPSRLQSTSISDTVEINNVDSFGPDNKSDVQLVTSEPKKSSKRNYVRKVEIKNDDSFGHDKKSDVQLVNSEPKKSSKRNSVGKVYPDHSNDLKSTVLTNVHRRNSKGETQLHSYSAKGKLISVVSLLHDGVSPNVVDNAGWTPLHEAVKCGHIEVVKLLIAYGAFLNVPGLEYETPLFTAIKYEQFDIAKLLLQKGANSKFINLYGINSQILNVEMWSKLSEFEMSDTSFELKEIPYTRDKIGIFLKKVNSVTVERFGAKFNAKVITENLFKNQLKQITHIIVPANKNDTCEMSYEILMGIANGICIVNVNWLIDSVKDGVLRPCSSYEVKGTMSNDVVNYNGPKMSRLNKQYLIPKLFDGIDIHITGSSNWENFSIDQLKEIVLEFGAKVLNRKPNPEDRPLNIIPYHCRDSEQMRHVSTIVLYTEDSKRLIKYNMNHLKVLPISWFMEAAQKYRIDYYT